MKLLPLPDQPTAPAAPPSQPGRRFRQPSAKQMGYALLAIAMFGLTVWAFRPAPVPVTLGQVERGPLQVTVNAEGKTQVRDRFTVSAPVDGHLERIVLNEGDPVQPGAIVAQIEPLPLTAAVQSALGRLAEWQAERAGVATQRPKSETLAQASTHIQTARTNQQQAEAKVAQAQAALEQAQRDRLRAQQLESTGALPRQQRESAELNATTRAKDLEAAKLAARVAANEVAVAEAALSVLQQEQTDPDYLLKVYDARIASTEAELSNLRDEANRTEIRSPVQGRVLRILQKSAQYVTSGTPLLELGDVSKLELVIDVLSTDAERIRPGDSILLERSNWLAPSDAQPIRAQVRRIEPAAFTKVSALGVEEQRVNVIGDFVDRPLFLGDAYRVEARIVVWAGQNVLKVPLSALFRCNQNWCTFVVEQQRARKRSITVAHRSDVAAEVTAGLNAGESVILHPNEQIRDGQRVRSR